MGKYSNNLFGYNILELQSLTQLN